MDRMESETQSRILLAGKAEFLQKGYKDASLRSIAHEAKVTTGAIYGYYKDKHALFSALVSPAATALKDLFMASHAEFEKQPPDAQIAGMHNHSDQALLNMLRHVYDNFDAFKLICCCSAGTDYEEYFHDMVYVEVQSTKRFAEVLNANGYSTRNVSENLLHLLSNAYINSVFETVVHDMPWEEAREYVAELTAFFGAGWDRLLGMH